MDPKKALDFLNAAIQKREYKKILNKIGLRVSSDDIKNLQKVLAIRNVYRKKQEQKQEQEREIVWRSLFSQPVKRSFTATTKLYPPSFATPKVKVSHFTTILRINRSLIPFQPFVYEPGFYSLSKDIVLLNETWEFMLFNLLGKLTRNPEFQYGIKLTPFVVSDNGRLIWKRNLTTEYVNFSKKAKKAIKQQVLKVLEKIRAEPYRSTAFLTITPGIALGDKMPKRIAVGAYNCFLQCVKDANIHVGSKNDKFLSRQALNNYLDMKNESIVNDEGLSPERIELIAKHLNIKVTLYDQLNNVWMPINHFRKSGKPNNNIRNLEVIIHNEHAYKKIDLKAPVIIQYDEELDFIGCKGIKSAITENDEVLGYTEFTFDRRILHKKKSNIFYSDEDFELNKDNYNEVFTITSRRYKDFRKINNLVLPNVYPDELRKFIIASDVHRQPWINPLFKKVGCVNSYDVNKAYPSACIGLGSETLKKYHALYQFPKLYTQFIAVDEGAESGFCLSFTGCSQVNVIDLKFPYLKACGYLKSGGIYPNNLLAYLRDLGCEFTLTYTAYHPENQKLEWPITNINEKKFNNRFIGRMIPNLSKSQTLHVTSEEEFRHLHYILHTNPNYKICHDDIIQGIICYIDLKSTVAKLGYHHIHSYILAYQQINFLDTVLKLKLKKIWKTNVDAVYTAETMAPSSEPGFFKFEKSVFPNKFATEDFLGDLNFNDDIPTTYSTASRALKYVIQLTTGEPGTGKTYNAIKQPYYNQLLLAPEHRICEDVEKKFTIDCPTLDTYFSIIVGKEWDLELSVARIMNNYYCNIVIDEVTKLSDKKFEFIESVLKCTGQCLHLLGDFHDDMVCAQIPPVKADPISSSLDFQLIFDRREHLTKNHRVLDPELSRRLKIMRDTRIPNVWYIDPLTGEKHYKMSIELLCLIKLWDDRIIKKLPDDIQFGPDSTDMILTATSNNRNGLNRYFKRKEPNNAVWYRNNPEFQKRKDLIPHKLIRLTEDEYLMRDIELKFPHARYEGLRDEYEVLAYANTVHSAEGMTVTGRVFIDTYMLDFIPQLFYVAASRVRSCDQIFILNRGKMDYSKFYSDNLNNI